MSIFDIFKRKNPKIKEEILRLAKNEISMETVPGREVTDLAASKIGGKPFLPSNFVWPVYTSKDDEVARPLTFFCQLNLSQIAPLDKEEVLPRNGLLSFFYECESFRWGFDPEDRGAARVFYFENTAGFAPTEFPAELSQEYIMPELAVCFNSKTSYPVFDEFDILSDLDCDWEAYDRVLSELGVDVEADQEGHKILGYADVIQNEMISECERITRGMYCGNAECYQNTPEEETADIEEKAKDWTLLLQLGTIESDDFEWMFGDCGMLYFYIKKEDLQQQHFENVWFSLQCG